MKQKGVWKARVIMLAVVAVMGAAFMTMLNAAGDPVAVTGSGEVAACTASQSSEADAWTADFEAPGTSSQQAGEVAICRLLPECWSNSDCDFKCGVGLGKCIHSKCPVRVCRC